MSIIYTCVCQLLHSIDLNAFMALYDDHVYSPFRMLIHTQTQTWYICLYYSYFYINLTENTHSVPLNNNRVYFSLLSMILIPCSVFFLYLILFSFSYLFFTLNSNSDVFLSYSSQIYWPIGFIFGWKHNCYCLDQGKHWWSNYDGILPVITICLFVN